MTIYHKESEIEFRFNLSLPPSHSRISELQKRLGSFTLKRVDLEGVLEIWGWGFNHSEDLKALGLIRTDREFATIDLPRIVRSIRSELVIINFRKRLPSTLKLQVFRTHISQNSLPVGGDKIKGFLEVVLDYGNLWYKHYDSFTLRDVEFNISIKINEPSLEGLIPGSFKQRIRESAGRADAGDAGATHLLELITEKFLRFQDDDILAKLHDMVSFDPPQGIKVVGVIPKMESVRITGTRQSLLLPGMLNLKISLNFEGGQLAHAVNYTLDLALMKRALGSIVAEIVKEADSLKP